MNENMPMISNKKYYWNDTDMDQISTKGDRSWKETFSDLHLGEHSAASTILFVVQVLPRHADGAPRCVARWGFATTAQRQQTCLNWKMRSWDGSPLWR